MTSSPTQKPPPATKLSEYKAVYSRHQSTKTFQPCIQTKIKSLSLASDAHFSTSFTLEASFSYQLPSHPFPFTLLIHGFCEAAGTVMNSMNVLYIGNGRSNTNRSRLKRVWAGRICTDFFLAASINELIKSRRRRCLKFPAWLTEKKYKSFPPFSSLHPHSYFLVRYGVTKYMQIAIEHA